MGFMPRANAAALQALIPGIGFTLELITEALKELELEAAAASAFVNNPAVASDLKPRPRNEAKGGWPNDPKERSREMKRRLALAKRKKQKDQPKPQPFSSQSKAGTERWLHMTKKQRKAHLEAMQAGRRRKAARARVDAAVPTMESAS
jgi:hypothetical protein